MSMRLIFLRTSNVEDVGAMAIRIELLNEQTNREGYNEAQKAKEFKQF